MPPISVPHTGQSSSPGKFLLLPLWGIPAFVILYVVAAFLYPGGSDHDIHSRGFSLMHNYWCSLLKETAINGAQNRARPVAITAMALLCLALSGFWYSFGVAAGLGRRLAVFIRITGILSMATIMLLLAGPHDLVLNLSCSFGLLASAGIYAGLRLRRWTGLMGHGLLNLLLVGMNNLLYYGTDMYWLPVVQKLTFLSFLLWFFLIAWRLRQNAPASGGPGGFL